MLKTTYTTQSLMALLSVSAESSVTRRAEKEGWKSIPRKGRGGGSEWLITSMPQATRQTIALALVKRSVDDFPVPQKPEVPATYNNGTFVHSTSLAGFTQKQREAALARLSILREVERLSDTVGKEAAIKLIVDASAEGTLAPHIAALIPIANYRYREGSTGLSRRPLYHWMQAYAEGGEAALAPKVRQQSLQVPSWAEAFLPFYQRPQNPSISLAYKDFCKACRERGIDTVPSYDAVKRFLQKMSLVDKEHGRKTGNARLKLMPHKRRITKDLMPGDVYTADGTTFDAEVAHPYNGQPFKPEVTIVLDVATRRAVGASIAFSECALTILDALRMACLFGGVPAMLYTDNGSGYKNNILLSPSIGMLARLGIEMVNSIPGRPQGKGLMERAIQTICEPAAKRLPTCTHRDMDGDSARKVFKLTRADIKAGRKSKLLPSWDDFRAAMVSRIEEYNATPHRALPKITDATSGKLRHMSPDEMWHHYLDLGTWEPAIVPDSVLDDLWMPSERRIVKNGAVQFFSKFYYAPELADLHKEMVEVRYDVWDASTLQVYRPDGEKICTAVLDGNAISYFPMSHIEEARERRKQAQLKRLESKAQRIDPEARLELPEKPQEFLISSVTPPLPVAASTTHEGADVLDSQEHELVIFKEPDRRPVFVSTFMKYEWLMWHKKQWFDADRRWLETYVRSEEYGIFVEQYQAKGIAWDFKKPTARQ